jgi:hypothetical protein
VKTISNPDAMDMEMEPVFIAGCGRSGTTYIRTLLNAHPEVFIPTESLFLADYLEYFRYVPKRLAGFLLFREPQFMAWYTGEHFQVRKIQEAVRRAHEYEAKAKGARRWGQKTPRFIRYIDLFDKNMGSIQWILVYRDPRAVVASMLKSKRHTYSLKRACDRWVRDNQPIIEAIQKRKANILTIKYEEMIDNLERTLGDILEFLDLQPMRIKDLIQRAQVEELRGSKFKVNAVREGLKPEKKFVEAWKDYLTESQIAHVEAKCSREMAILGYGRVGQAGGGVQGKPDMGSWAMAKDLLVVVEYLKSWPSYLLYTVIRKGVFISCRFVCKATGIG